MQFQSIIQFWFSEIQPAQWWKKDEAFDQSIAERFRDLHQSAIQCELSDWRKEPLGRLAEVIVLDQFSRNIFRDQPEAFAADSMALTLAQEAIALEDDQRLHDTQRLFLYMPFMHSESPMIHQRAVELFSDLGLQNNFDYELKHKKIVDRFGRYPHRNKILGRESTPEEIEFLQQPGSSF